MDADFLFCVLGDHRVYRLAQLAGTGLLCLALSSMASVAGSVTARVNLSRQTITVFHDGRFVYRWPVSTARRGYHTPVGRYRAKWLSRYHRSKKYHNSPMPYSIFFKGGYAVHGTEAIRHLGHPASHGCVRLHPANAAKLFALVKEEGLINTEIVVTP